MLRNNNFLSMFGNVMFAGLAFLSFATIARTYTPHDFGRYMLFVVAGTFIEMLRFGLTRTSIVKFLMVAGIKERKSLVGSNYLIGLATTLIINTIIAALYYLQKSNIEQSGFYLFLKWYPWMALANLPMNNAISLMLAKEHFGRLLFVRFISNIVFLIYAAINFFYLKYSVETTIVVQICSQLLTSIVCIALGWDGLIRIIFVTRESVIKLLNFGKYSMGTLISTSLLKSADTFILGLVPILGIDSVALYSIPLKLSELLEIPLRSFAATLYPRMAKASNCAKRTVLSALYHDYTGMLFYFFLPILIFCELFAYPLVLIFGGEQYLAAVPIFRLYILYGLFLPFDRITGVGLDAVGAPKYNLLKVVVMAAINIGGDLAALLVFKSLYAMAIVTIVNTFVGAYIGYVVLNRYIPIRFSQIFVRGWKFILAKKATIYEHLTK